MEFLIILSVLIVLIFSIAVLGCYIDV